MWFKAALLLIAPALYAQSIEGTVVNSVTRAPVATLTLTFSGPATYTAVTDAAGAFRVASVQPGQYTAKIQTTSSFVPELPLKPFRVGDGPVKLSYEIEPFGRLEGRVFYPDGRPAPRATLWVVLYPRGGAITHTAGEDGRFRIEGLNAGSYLLRAEAPRNAPAPQGEAWAPTFFPNATDRAAAEPVRVRPGADLGGFDIRLRSAPVYRVRGVVRDESGKPAPRVPVRLAIVERSIGPEQEVQSGEDGSFEFSAVRTGEWLLYADTRENFEDLKGFARAIVSRTDLEGIDIRLRRAFPLFGFVDREEPRDASGERKVTAVYLVPAGPQYELGASSFHKQDGNFVIPKVYPGAYFIEPLGFVPGYYLDSVTLGPREVFGQPVEIVDGSQRIRITYKADAPRVRGTVEKGEGAIVALIPEDESLVSDQFIRTAAADRDGRFEVGSLRPGHYYAFAFDRVNRASLRDPIFVRSIAARAERVHVEKGELRSIDLKVMSWPEL